MLKKGREADTVVCDVGFFTDHKDVELAPFSVLLDDFLTGQS